MMKTRMKMMNNTHRNQLGMERDWPSHLAYVQPGTPVVTQVLRLAQRHEGPFPARRSLHPVTRRSYGPARGVMPRRPLRELRALHEIVELLDPGYPQGFYAGLPDALPDMFTTDEHHHRLDDRNPAVAARG